MGKTPSLGAKYVGHFTLSERRSASPCWIFWFAIRQSVQTYKDTWAQTGCKAINSVDIARPQQCPTCSRFQ